MEAPKKRTSVRVGTENLCQQQLLKVVMARSLQGVMKTYEFSPSH